MESFKNTGRTCLAIAAFLAGSAGPVCAQDRIWYVDGPHADAFMSRFDIAADLDADGLPELLAGANATLCPAWGDGAAFVFSSTGGELQRFCGVDELMGQDVSSIGDLDADGVDDFIVGAPYWRNPDVSNSRCGRVLAISSGTYQVLFDLRSGISDLRFGEVVLGLPDLNGDGGSEVLVGQPRYLPNGGGGRGRVQIFSSIDGSIVREHHGESDYDSFGSDVALLGDVDLDGVADYCVSAPLNNVTNDEVGKVYVYSGASGSLIHSWMGIKNDDELGRSLADAGDLDGDGIPDVLCGGRNGPTGFGHVDAYSGSNGEMLFQLTAENSHKIYTDEFGASCSMAGDVNGDGVKEIVIGAPLDRRVGLSGGRVDLFCGRTHRPLYHFYPGKNYSQLGQVVKGWRDWNGDSIPDFAAGSPAHASRRGRITLYAGNDLYLQAEPTDPVPDEIVTVEIRGGEPGALAAMVLVDVNGTPTFTPLVVDLLDSNGELSMTGCAPDDGSGLSVTLIGYAQKLSGKPKLIDTSHETITVQ